MRKNIYNSPHKHQSAYFNAIILYIANYFPNFAHQDQGVSLSYYY